MTELAHLKAIEAELSTAPDESADTEGAITQRSDIQRGIRLANSLAEVGRDLDELIANMASEIQTLTAERDSYCRGQEATEQENVVLKRKLSVETERADHNGRRLDKALTMLSHINQYAEHGLYGMRHGGAEPPLSPPDDGEPAPAFLTGSPSPLPSNVKSFRTRIGWKQ